jgi:glycosyltransferase involved in cell wall biosynthesis
MSTIKISVILPCYNHARFLPERIHSVVNQSYPVDQIIFLDDASTDASVDIARQLFSDFNREVTFIENKLNSGSPFHQWNLGVEHARNDYIWIAETDDRCELDFLENMVYQLHTFEAVLSYANSNSIDEVGAYLPSPRRDKIFTDHFNRDFVMDGNEFRKRFLNVRNVIPNASAVVFKKETFIQVGMANSTMRNCGDWEMWSKMSEYGTFAYVSKPLNHFRFHATTTRNAGFKPHASAETLAIVLQSPEIMTYSRDNTITFMALVRMILFEHRRPLYRNLTASKWSKLTEIKQCYAMLSRVPKITQWTWYSLGFLNFLYWLNSKLRYFLKRSYFMITSRRLSREAK